MHIYICLCMVLNVLLCTCNWHVCCVDFRLHLDPLPRMRGFTGSRATTANSRHSFVCRAHVNKILWETCFVVVSEDSGN